MSGRGYHLICHWLLEISYCHGGDPTRACVVVPQHEPLSFYTKLEGPSVAKLELCFPWYGLWMTLKGPWIFMVTTLKYMCKAALG